MRPRSGWAAAQEWTCLLCGAHFAPEDVSEEVLVAFVPQSRLALVWQTGEDRRKYPNRWNARCPECRQWVVLVNPANDLLIEHKRRVEINFAFGLVGVLLGFSAMCSYPYLVPFIWLAVALCVAVVTITAPRAPWWR